MQNQNSSFIPHLSSLILSVGLLLTGIGGAFLPWVWRESVALQLTAPGLAEFVKFLPEVRTGQLDFKRLFFLLPLFLAMLALPLFAANQSLTLPGWLQWLMRLMVVPLSLATLSPVWTPVILIAPEFRLQTGLALVALALTTFASLFKKLPLKLLVALLVLTGIPALTMPVWQFNLVQAGLGEAYHQPVSLGWGWWVTAGGIVLSTASGIWVASEKH